MNHEVDTYNPYYESRKNAFDTKLIEINVSPTYSANKELCSKTAYNKEYLFLLLYYGRQTGYSTWMCHTVEKLNTNKNKVAVLFHNYDMLNHVTNNYHQPCFVNKNRNKNPYLFNISNNDNVKNFKSQINTFDYIFIDVYMVFPNPLLSYIFKNFNGTMIVAG